MAQGPGCGRGRGQGRIMESMPEFERGPGAMPTPPAHHAPNYDSVPDSASERIIAEFLKGLPSYNKNNFSRFHTRGSRSYAKRLSVNLQTKDSWEKKSALKKRNLQDIDSSEDNSSNKKKPHLETSP